MPTRRRDFLKDILMAGSLPALLATPKGLEIAEEFFNQGRSQAGAALEPDQATIDFWANYMNPNAPVTRGGSMRGQKFSVSPLAGTPLEREPAFLHYDDNGFRTPDQISPSELSPANGDVSVSFSVAGFKPANEDRATFEKLQSGSLRLDLVQDKPSLVGGALDQATWMALAGMFPTKDSKLPPLTNLTFDPNTAFDKPQTMTLPGGTGKWGINLGVQRKDSKFCQILSQLTTEVGRFAPILGLPSIALGAISSFNKLFAYLYAKPQWILQTNGVPVYATSDTWKAAGAGKAQGVPLKTANYVLVPQAHMANFQKSMNGLVMRDNFIVPKNAGVDIYSAAEAALPDVTYATLAVQVKSAQMPCGGGVGSKTPANKSQS